METRLTLVISFHSLALLWDQGQYSDHILDSESPEEAGVVNSVERRLGHSIVMLPKYLRGFVNGLLLCFGGS